MNAIEYAAPTPRIFYIHDDLSDYVHQVHGIDSPVARLTEELFRTVRKNPQQVVVLHLEAQITSLLAQEDHAPFACTIGIGRAGERVANLLHDRTGWFPAIRRVDVTRQEDGRGGYNLVSTSEAPLTVQLQGIEETPSLAVVDDTIFSGLTMRTILRALPAAVLHRTHAFCLRGIAASLPHLRALCPVSIGFAAHGQIFDEVSFINATGLVLRVGIRREGQPPMAFFERPMWMHAWFPGYAYEVIDICRRLNALLEPGC